MQRPIFPVQRCMLRHVVRAHAHQRWGGNDEAPLFVEIRPQAKQNFK